jgi:hypothetical protein
MRKIQLSSRPQSKVELMEKRPTVILLQQRLDHLQTIHRQLSHEGHVETVVSWSVIVVQEEEMGTVRDLPRQAKVCARLVLVCLQHESHFFQPHHHISKLQKIQLDLFRILYLLVLAQKTVLFRPVIANVAVDELATQQVPVVLQESQIVISEVLCVFVLHFQFFRRIPVNSLEKHKYRRSTVPFKNKLVSAAQEGTSWDCEHEYAQFSVPSSYLTILNPMFFGQKCN